MYTRILYLGGARQMDANDMTGFAPSEIADILVALDLSIVTAQENRDRALVLRYRRIVQKIEQTRDRAEQ